MNPSRRDALRDSLSLVAAAAAPEFLFTKPKTGYSRAEIDDRIKSEKGLEGATKADLVTPAL
jgi:hypothetical protein